ncbi:MAG TPA: DegQ family serine endoprotease [Stellaceae bacterium]|nr:DegQ family serine endoprotease [Stellaceae bacterium]
MRSRSMHPTHRRLAIAAALALGLGSAPAAARGPDGFSELAAKLTPAVVNIATMHKAALSGSTADRGRGTPFDEFFHDFFGERDRDGGEGAGKGAPAEPSRPSQALGSGFIIDPSGIIVTNNHVIAEADSITVTLPDDTNIPAEVVGRDVVTDLALLKIAAKQPLPVVVWGDSNKARVGDWVLAIGDPFGLGGTVTAGILSARARELNAGPYDDFLQTDASINRGNSGGPMFNMAGEVIGINTAIYSPSGGSIGIGFAIPANLARPIIEQLRATGKVERGWLGVRIQPVTPAIAESIDLDRARGALVTDVDSDGPAAAAGIEPGDVVIGFDGKPVDRSRQLPRLVAGATVGKEMPLTLWRDGKEMSLKVTIGVLDPQKLVAARAPEPEPEPEAAVTALGLSLARITPQLRQRYRLGEAASGVIVVGVAGDAPAAEQGVAPGDIVAMVGRDAVATPEDVVEKIAAARQAQHRSVLLRLEHKGAGRYVAVPVEQG